MAAFEEYRQPGHSTTKYSLLSHFSCISPPARFSLFYFLYLSASLAAISHFCCQIFHPSFVSEWFMSFDCNGSLSNIIPPVSLCVPHLSGTGALMKTMLPMSPSLTTHRSRKKTLPPLSHPSKQSQMGSVEVLLSSNQQQ